MRTQEELFDRITAEVLGDQAIGGGKRPPPPPEAEVGASFLSLFVSLVLAIGLVAVIWFGLKESGMLANLMGPEPVPTTSPTPKVKASVKFLQQADEAFAAGKFLESATRAEQALANLKSENAAREELLAAKAKIARAYYKSKNYPEACKQYAELVKAKPADKKLKETAKLINGEYWRKELKPQLAEAERHLANGRRDEARDLALDVKAKAKPYNLDTKSANDLLNRVAQAETASLNKMSAARREAYMNEVIDVRITSTYNPMGTPTKMTRREYLRKKNSDEYN